MDTGIDTARMASVYQQMFPATGFGLRYGHDHGHKYRRLADSAGCGMFNTIFGFEGGCQLLFW